MAKVVENTIIINISRLVKDDYEATAGDFISSDVDLALEQVVQELIGSGHVVEVTRG